MSVLRVRAGWGGAVMLLAAALGTAGCGSGVVTGIGGGSGGGGGGTGTAKGAAFHGTVLAAGKPVTGATVRLYAAGAVGVGKGATALESAALTTDATGGFSVAAGYPCAAAATEVYAVARGGKVGTAASANAALAEMVVLGPCGGIASGATVVVNEATTVAGAWALNQFLSADGTVGASATNATGLANAVLMAQALVNAGTGTAPGVGFAGTATAPTATVNTLADLLSLCTADGGSAGCAAVLAGATPTGGAAPADALALALAVARSPARNVAALYAAAAASPVFSPVLPAAPLDWMVTVTYTGGGLKTVSGPTALAIDASGNAWVANYGGVVSVFSPVGVPLFANGISGGGLNSIYGLAIDGTGNVWAANGASDGSVNNGLGTVTEISAAGQFLSGTTGFGNGSRSGGFSTPVGIAIDPNGTVWVVNTENGTVTQLNSSGQTISGGSGYGSSALAFPGPIAIDGSHNAWVGNMNAQQMVKISADGTTVKPVTCCDGPQGLAIDAGGSVWAANYYGNSVSRVASDGSVASGSPYTGATLTTPSAIAVDGAGSVWVGNFRENLLTELAGSGAATPGAVLSPGAGWASEAGLDQPFALAVDASGDVWVSNFAAGTVTELVGVAAPVKTPLLGPVQQP